VVSVLSLGRQITVISALLAVSWPLAANDLSTYRGFALGATTAEVMKLAGTPDRDLKTLHARPAMLQELSWRPPFVVADNNGERDSVAVMVFSFVDDQLFRMTVDYDRSRTAGLTPEDVAAALTAVYGPRSAGRPPAAADARLNNLDAPAVLAFWHQGDTAITLTRFAYSSLFTLTIASQRLEALARQSLAAAAQLDAQEAPAREAARAKARAAAEREAAEKTRTANRATFEP
jgi:hypothetical protein